MAIASYAKYVQNEDLRRQLFRTAGAQLIEANRRDFIWGVGLEIDDPQIIDPAAWRGLNALGIMLTVLRERLAIQSTFKEEWNQCAPLSPAFGKPPLKNRNVLERRHLRARDFESEQTSCGIVTITVIIENQIREGGRVCSGVFVKIAIINKNVA